MPFELVVDPTTLVILAGVAFLAGFIDAIAGGGGLLTIPALLTAGVPPHLALGTNKLSSTFGAAVASYTFYRRKLFQPRQWRKGLIATAIGAALGAWAAHLMPAEWLNRMLPVVVFGCGLYLLFGRTPRRRWTPIRALPSAASGHRVWAWVSTTAWPGPALAPSGLSAPC